MNYLKKHYKNLLVLITGLIVLGFGGFIIVISSLGGDSFTVFNQGIANTLNIDVGYGIIIGNLFFIAFLLIFNRKTIGIGTVLVAVLVGLFINLFIKIIPLSALDNKYGNFFFSMAGLVVSSLGLAIYIYSDTGLGGFESFVSYFAEKFKLHFFIMKIIIDAILFTVGALMGGVFGITSILSVLLIGPLIEVFLILLKKTNIIKDETNNIDEKINQHDTAKK